jgi:hypothetical protein
LAHTSDDIKKTIAAAEKVFREIWVFNFV